jgi:predicted phosphodiesterase
MPKTLTARIQAAMTDNPSLPTRQIAKNLGVSYDTVRGIVSRIRRRATGPEEADERMVPAAELDRARSRISRLERRVKDAEQAALSENEVRRQIFGLAEASEKQPEWSLGLERLSTPHAPGMPITIWSDWHIGETVSRAEVNGVNEFNMKIAERRVRRLISKTIELCFDHMTNPTYPGIVVVLGGDMVSGEIHDELVDTNDEHLLPVVLEVVNWITGGLLELQQIFGRVYCPCVDGNHGRNTLKIRNKSFRYKNFDWLIYSMVEAQIRATGIPEEDISFSIPPSNEVRFDVYGHRFFVLHGHDIGVRGGDGIIGALGPIKRGTIKVGAQQAEIGRGFDTLLLGHWHQYINVHGVIVNPTLKGFDEFAAKSLRAVAQPPAQALFFVHPKYGITASWQVFVESGKPVADSAPLVVWS